MSAMKKPPIHLWIYNHPFFGISDQVEFFLTVFQQHGYPVTLGRQPCRSSLNVVIENFSEHARDTLIDFCKTSKKRVAVIMTEHLDFIDGEILIHGDPLWTDNDYMHPATQIARIKNLFDCLPYLRCFLLLGDLPELRNMPSMLSGISIRTIPFPRLDLVSNVHAAEWRSRTYDLLFTGVFTDYRSRIYDALKSNDFSVHCPKKFVSRKTRDRLNRTAKVVLNIPQREGWRWLSLMRIVAALRCGRATVSLGTRDDSKIAACCPQLDISDQGWPGALREHVENWPSLYRTAYENYMSMANEFERVQEFPDDAFEYWAITDRQ